MSYFHQAEAKGNIEKVYNPLLLSFQFGNSMKTATATKKLTYGMMIEHTTKWLG